MQTLRVLMLGCLIAAIPPAGAQTPGLTESRAIEVASAYCRSVDIAVTALPTATFCPVDEKCYLARWKVTWRDEAEVEVADRTGAVLRVYNAGLVRRLGRQPVGTPIPEAEAVERAARALSLAQQGADLSYWKARCDARTELSANHCWTVFWRRVWNEVPYRADSARALIHAETGALIGLGAGFASAPPTTRSMSVSPGAAAATATARIIAAGKTASVPELMQVEVVRPNTFYQPGGSTSKAVGASRVAWVCRFFGIEGEWERHFDVFVDAETGAVVGGESWGPMGHSRRPSLAQRLASAREVQVFGRRSNGAWTQKPIAILSARANKGVLAALRQADGEARPPRSFGDRKLTIISDGGGPFDLTYVEGSGLIGWGPQWVAAPKEFKELVAKLGHASK